MKKNSPAKDLLSIGTLAQSFGVSDNTIRRMEAAGLLKPALIKYSGYRYYDSENISRIKLLLALRSFGLVYEDMRMIINDPSDFRPVYEKLYEKKLLLDTLLEQARLFLRPENPEEIFYISHGEIPFYTKSFFFENGAMRLELDKLCADVYLQAVSKKLPVDFFKPVTIMTSCEDYTKFDPTVPQSFTIMIPLREAVEGSDIRYLNKRKLVSFAWYKGLDFQDMVSLLSKYMAEKGLRQCAPLGATFEIGEHVDKKVKEDNYLLHFMIPVEEI